MIVTNEGLIGAGGSVIAVAQAASSFVCAAQQRVGTIRGLVGGSCRQARSVMLCCGVIWPASIEGNAISSNLSVLGKSVVLMRQIEYCSLEIVITYI